MNQLNNNKPLLFATVLPDAVSDLDFKHLNSLVSFQRRERIRRFIFQEDIARSLVGEILLRYGLLKYGLRETDTIQFSLTEYGKPILTGFKNIDFSISHSGKYVVVGIHSNQIGVDVEQVNAKIDLSIADQFFAEEECKLIKNCDCENTRLDMFHRIWVLKEAYIKAIGKGLSCPLNSFSVNPISNDGIELVLSDSTSSEMSLIEYSLHKEYKCCACVMGESIPKKLEIVDLNAAIDMLN